VKDVIFVALIVAFFVLSVLLVRFCDWLIGPADASSTDAADPEVEDATERQAA
jgi:hypothetical protein